MSIDGPSPAAKPTGQPTTIDLEDLSARLDRLDNTLLGENASIGPSSNGSDVVRLTPLEVTQGNVTGYDILSELGRGGMGVVYKARHQRLNRLTALKMILTGPHSSNQERERFRREAEAVAALQHPHIVQIFEVGEADGFPYLALEFVDGRSLAQILDGAPWPARAAAGLVELLARAVHHAHERGIVHRDLKPGNVLLAHHDEVDEEDKTRSPKRSFHPKITDFGLAKRIIVGDTDNDATTPGDGIQAASGNTRTGAVMGTPSYIAPEQAAGKNRDIGPATDVYALGAILYELLTGRPPFRGETPLDTVLQVLSDEPVSPRQLHPKVPHDLETICLKCLKKEPWKRYASAIELADDLQRFLRHQPISARPVSWWERGLKLAKRRPTAVATIATLGIALLTLLAVSVSFNVELRRAAEREQSRARDAEIAERAMRIAAGEARNQARLAQEAERKAIREQLEADRQRRIVEEEVEKSRRSLYALQLTQVANLAPSDPARALELLNHRRRCPMDLRDFTWFYLRRVCQRQESVLNGHNGPINSIAYSPDGRWLASASWDGSARIWNVSTGRTVAVLTGHEGLVLATVFAPDGRSLITGGDDRSVRVWRLPLDKLNALPADAEPLTLQTHRVLAGHRDCIRCIAFAGDGRSFATGASDGSVRIWEWPDGFRDTFGIIASASIPTPEQPHERAVLSTKQGTIWSIALSPDGQWLACGGENRTVCWYDLTAPIPTLKRTEKHPEAVIALAFSPDSLTLASVCNTDDAAIHLWDAKSGLERARLRGHTRAIYGIAFSRSGKWLASGSFDRTVRLWDHETGEERSVLKGHSASVRCVAFSPDRKTFASAGMDQSIRLWSIASPSSETTSLTLSSPLSAAVWSQDGQTFITGGHDGIVRVWRSTVGTNRVSFEEIGRLIGHVGPVLAITLSKDRQTVITSGQDGTVRLWKVPATGSGTATITTIKPITTLPGVGSPVRDMALSPDESLLAAASDNGLRVWSMRDRQTRPGFASISGRVRAVAFTLDGQHLISAGGRNMQLWDPHTGKHRSTMMLAHLGEIDALAFNKTGDTLATADVDGSVKIWDMPRHPQDRMTERALLSGHTDAVLTLTFTDDGRTLVSASRDRTIRLWDPVTGQERATLAGHADAILKVMLKSFDRQPLTLWSISRDGSVRWWESAAIQ